MQVQVDFVLDVEVRPKKEAQQLVDIVGDLLPEVGLDQGVPIERRESGPSCRRSVECARNRWLDRGLIREG
jgi:hypothetical protein